MAEDFRERARLWPKGRLYEDFEVGEVRVHHWGRTIALSDTLLFTTLTLSFNPLYSNRVYAEAHGHPDIVGAARTPRHGRRSGPLGEVLLGLVDAAQLGQ